MEGVQVKGVGLQQLQGEVEGEWQGMGRRAAGGAASQQGWAANGGWVGLSTNNPPHCCRFNGVLPDAAQ